MSRLKWAEEDFAPPCGSTRLVAYQPTSGQTYVMYHGTDKDSARAILASGFRRSSDGMLGPGVYLSRDLDKASRYPIGLPDGDKVVIKVLARVGKVKAIDQQKHPMQKTWHQNGYDSAWVPPHCGMVPSGCEENCIWDPARITILCTIQPKAVGGTNMSRLKWAEEDFAPPCGSTRLVAYQPTSGQTYVMYHGTTRASSLDILASGFRQSSDGMLGPGVYLSRDLEKASRYPIGLPDGDKVVIKVLARVGKVKAIDRQNHPMQKTWHQNGYDSAWVPPNCGMVPSGCEENCIWDPARITILCTIQPKAVGGNFYEP